MIRSTTLGLTMAAALSLTSVLVPTAANAQSCPSKSFIIEKPFAIGSASKLRGSLTAKLGFTQSGLRRTGTLRGTGTGCILNNCYSFVNVSVDTNSQGGSRAVLKVGLLPAWERGLAGFGSFERDSSISLVKVSGKYPIIPGVNLEASANVGAGYAVSIGHVISVSPPAAALGGEAKVFANGSGSLGVSILAGVGGRAWGSATLTFPSPKLKASLTTASCGKTGNTGRLTLASYRLHCSLNYEALCAFGRCAKRGSTTLLDKGGVETTLANL